jgi:hypothetical protein
VFVTVDRNLSVQQDVSAGCDRERPPQGCVELVQEGPRRGDAAHAKGAVDHFTAQPLSDQRRDEDVGVENNGHETMRNTSSSV